MKGRLFIKLPYLVAPSRQKPPRLLVERPLNFIQPFVHPSQPFVHLSQPFIHLSKLIGDGLKLAVQLLSRDGIATRENTSWD